MATLRVGVLGAVEVHSGRERLAIAPGRQQALVVQLLDAGGRLVPVHHLVTNLWPDLSDRSGLHVLISRLRRSLGEHRDRLQTNGEGYRLDLLGVVTDSGAFDEAVASARDARQDPADAVEGYRAALGLWRGVALSGVPGVAADHLRVRLEERRLVAREELVEALLAAGHLDACVDEARQLCADAPFRERAWRAQMVGLHLSGARRLALACYQDLRATLADAGLEPQAESRRLDEAIACGRIHSLQRGLALPA